MASDAQNSPRPSTHNRSLAIRIALAAYPDARPPTAIERAFTVVIGVVLLAILVTLLVLVVQLTSAGFADSIWIVLLLPGLAVFIVLADFVSDASEHRVGSPSGAFDRFHWFVMAVQQRLLRAFGITPLFVGWIAVGLFGRLRPMELVLEDPHETVPTWLPRAKAHPKPWNLNRKELSRMDDWSCARGPLRVYVRTISTRDFCTTPAGFERIRAAAERARAG
ncbi:MAG: hypothetical protein ABL309_07205 [Phycisphaerales bacterium]